MEAHYTFIGNIVKDPNWQKFYSALILGGLILLFGFFSRFVKKQISSDQALVDSVVPSKKISLFGIFDLFIEAFVKYHDNILGKSNRKYISFSASIFLFVFLSNLLGLFPGMAAITTTVWVNVAIALVVFIYFNAKGIEVNGWIGHLKHFCGPLWWLAWFMFPIELLGAVLRILTLNLRLYWNINADHLVLGIFTDQFKIMGSFFYGLGLFVSFMQAFIFTTLTMVYILLSVQHSEKH